jgi:hypothetical protein
MNGMQDASTITLHLLTYAEPMLRDLKDDHVALAAHNGKTAGWLLGHLCITGDFIRRKMGRPPLTPKEWGARFAPGSTPSSTASDYPPVADLRAAFDAVYRDLSDSAPSISEEVLAAPSPFEPGRARFPTTREFLTWIMTGHLGYHIGQLHGWHGEMAGSRV